MSAIAVCWPKAACRLTASCSLTARLIGQTLNVALWQDLTFSTELGNDRKVPNLALHRDRAGPQKRSLADEPMSAFRRRQSRRE